MGRPRISSKCRPVHPVAVLLDLMNDRYAEWCEEARTVRDAYKGWSSAPLDRQTGLYLKYQEALDQEASAASQYALAVADVVNAVKHGVVGEHHGRGSTFP